MNPLVSIVIPNYNHPEIIDVCLRTLEMTEADHEVIVVDNGSVDGVEALMKHKDEGRIDKLLLEPVNHFFSEGTNIGARNASPESEFILMLNSDVGFLRYDWLTRQLEWMEDTIKTTPSVWGLRPTVPKPGPRDIVSIGWTHDVNVQPGRIRPEGWCCLFRRSVWRDMSPDFPFHYGFEEMVAGAVRDGARCGVLSQYGKYLVHREGATSKDITGAEIDRAAGKRVPDIAGWFAGLDIEGLDFTLGDFEHDSYISW